MKESLSTISETGQLTVPAEVRRHLGLDVGDPVAFVIADDGTVRLRPPAAATLDELQGSAGSLPQPLSWDAMIEIASQDQVRREPEE